MIKKKAPTKRKTVIKESVKSPEKNRKTAKKSKRPTKLPAGCPCPTWLEGVARDVFVYYWQLAQKLPSGWPLDVQQLAIYADQYSSYAKLSGTAVATPDDKTTAEFQARCHLSKQMSIICERLGLNDLSQKALKSEQRNAGSLVGRRDRSKLKREPS